MFDRAVGIVGVETFVGGVGAVSNFRFLVAFFALFLLFLAVFPAAAIVTGIVGRFRFFAFCLRIAIFLARFGVLGGLFRFGFFFGFGRFGRRCARWRSG